MDRSRHLECRQLPPAVLDQRLGLGVLGEGHGRRHQLAVLVVLDPEADRITDGGMGQQDLLDLGRRDVLAAADDHLLEAPLQVEVAVPERAAVAGPEPVAEECLHRGRRVVHVTGHHPAAADDNLARAPVGQEPPVLINHADLGAGRHADRAGHPRCRGLRIRGHLVARLGHPVGLQHRHPVTALRSPHQRRRQRRTAGADEPEGAGRPGLVGLVQHHLVQCRAGRQPGRPVLAGLRPEPVRGEPARGDDRAAGTQCREGGGDQAVDVEQRHDGERDVRGAEPVMRGDRAGRGHQVPLAQRNLLRAAGRPAGVQDDGHVIRPAPLERHRGPHGLPGHQQVRRPVPVGPDGEHRGAGGRRGAGRRGRAAVRDQEQPRRDVRQEEGELTLGVGRVERRCRRPEQGDRQQQLDEAGAVGQRERNAVAAPDAGRREAPGQRLDPVRDLRVGQYLAVLGHDERRP